MTTECHGNGRLVPARGTNEHVRYLHWMHFAEGIIMLHLVARLYLGGRCKDDAS